eukprot:1480435-Alexandrium_andersonii.AAC.1
MCCGEKREGGGVLVHAPLHLWGLACIFLCVRTGEFYAVVGILTFIVFLSEKGYLISRSGTGVGGELTIATQRHG